MRKVLVVDGDEIVRGMLQDVLEHARYTVRATGSPAFALTLLKTEHFDAVLADKTTVNSADITAEFRVHAPSATIVVMSSYGFEPPLPPQGVDATLPKPFRLQELFKAIGEKQPFP